MARVAVFVPDLLFGSRVLEALRGAGHEPVLVDDVAGLAHADAVIADLTFDAASRVELIARARAEGVPVLAFYSHVEADVRDVARAAGFDLVVPRSRMAREGAALVSRLLAERSLQ